MERIHIGGLDPSRLSAKEVSNRLRSIAGIDVVSVDDCGGDKSFFFVNVKLSSEDMGVSAFDLVAKQYHNVKWKGCKLSVEGAKPHFLERLAAERQQRNQAEHDKSCVENIEVNESDATPPGIRVPRNLRIRQRFGEEAYCVDRKPRLTNDWSDFSMAIARMRKRRENYRRQMAEQSKGKESRTKDPKMKPFRNRAVHLVFNEKSRLSALKSLESAVAHKEEHASNVTIGTDQDSIQSVSTASEDDDTSEQQNIGDDDSGTSKSIESEDGKKVHLSAYAWSESGDSASSSDNGDVHGNETKLLDTLSDSDAEIQNQKETKRPNEAEVQKAYVWSSDEEQSSSDSEEEKNRKEKSRYSRQGSSSEVMASVGLQGTDETDESESVVESRGESSVEEDAMIGNLQDDVKSNLDVLSKLFPDMSTVAPNLVENHAHGMDSTGKRDGVGQSRELMQSGWEMHPSMSNGAPSYPSTLGLMQRYDPTKESAKKYVVSSEPSESANSKNDAVPERQADDENPKPATAGVVVDGNAQLHGNDTVYEQTKLEDIFRLSREQEETNGNQLASPLQKQGAAPPPQENRPSKLSGGSFAFSFDLKSEKQVARNDGAVAPRGPATSSIGGGGGSFAFSFDLGADRNAPVDPAEPYSGACSVEPFTGGKQPRKDNTAKPESGPEETVDFQRRGFLIPKSVLDGYEEKFFAMNDGTRIREDLEGFKNDGTLRQRWMAERHSLTQDWKRKRKYAQSRMQKQKKFR